MDDSNNIIQVEFRNEADENIIPFELVKKEDAVACSGNMEIDEIRSPKLEKVQEDSTPEPGPSCANPRNLRKCSECGFRADCIVQKKKKGEKFYFCTEKCLLLNSFKSKPRLVHLLPKAQPTPAPASASRPIPKLTPAPGLVHALAPSMQMNDVTSLFVRVCFSCSAVIQIHDYSNISWQARDFCNEKCLTKHQLRFNSLCMECKCSITNLSNFGKFSMKFGNYIRTFCSKSCLEKYKLTLNMCQFCNNDISNPANRKYLAPVAEYSTTFKQFCSIVCVKNYCHYRLQLPFQNDADNFANCAVCKALKQIQVKFQNKDILVYAFCSEFCFEKFQAFNKADVVQCIICQMLYEKIFFRRYCLFDNGVKNFCGQNCQTTYYIIARIVVDCHNCKVRKYNFDMIQKTFPNNQTIYACSFQCLKNSYKNMTRPVLNNGSQNEIRRLYGSLKNQMTLSIARNGALANKKNASTMCYPTQKDASTSTEFQADPKTTRTTSVNVDELPAVPFLVPVPIPIPVPIFIPTACRSQEEVATKMKKIREELPQDPLQADLVMLAKVEEKKAPAKKLKRKRKLKKALKRKVAKNDYSFGFNALARWMSAFNAQFSGEHSSNRRLESKPNLFKTDPLFMTRDELHKCLVAFLKEVKGVYPADVLYTIFLDIQQYLLQNNKAEYIFLDPSFKNFIEMFNGVAVGFLNMNSKVTEDILWTTNQLGSHSPYTLLNSLIYFNCKLFGLKTVQEHFDLLSTQITFTKKPKLNVSETKVKYIYRLKYYPKMVGEQGEKVSDIDKQFCNQKRCPGYLYEFYIKKCPSNAENGNKSFYLKPELACETDSPIWFSNQTLDVWTVEMMLNRIKMVKEINES